jgi:Co/Zn/Cd efflux system component
VGARAALLKGFTLFALGLWVAATTILHAYYGTVPKAGLMGAVGFLALLTNGAVALMLYRFRGGDSNMRSVWICSRNDAIGNVAVLLAAIGVFGSGTGWPDAIVASIMAALALSGGFQIIRHASQTFAPKPSCRRKPAEACREESGAGRSARRAASDRRGREA